GMKKLWHLYFLDCDAVNWALDGNVGSVWSGPTARLGLKLLSETCYVVMMALALLGFLTSVRANDDAQRRGGWIALLAITYFTAIYIVAVADDRYHAPVIPLFACAAALFLSRRVRDDAPRVPESDWVAIAERRLSD